MIRRDDEVEVHTDSQYVWNCFELGWVDKWMDNDWFNSQGKCLFCLIITHIILYDLYKPLSGEPCRHQEVLRNILELMNDITVNFVKIPREWNQEADRLAYQAACNF